MFVRPDWKDPKAYANVNKHGFNEDIAWEFVRRNPDYQEDVDSFLAESATFFEQNSKAFFERKYLTEHVSVLGFFLRDQQPERYERWQKLFEHKWGLCQPQTTDLPCRGAFSSPPDDYPESFERETYQGIKGPRVLVPVDLSEPLEMVLKKAEHQIRRMRDEGIKSGTVKPVTSRVLSTAVYIEYLRILDGIAAGETIQKIGEVLSPGAVNTPEERQRDKRIRAAHKAALKMQDGGYRVLIY